MTAQDGHRWFEWEPDELTKKDQAFQTSPSSVSSEKILFSVLKFNDRHVWAQNQRPAIPESEYCDLNLCGSSPLGPSSRYPVLLQTI
jgi:hypothetical protein